MSDLMCGWVQWKWMVDLQDEAATFRSLDKEGKPRLEATPGVVQMIEDGLMSLCPK